MRRCPLPPVHTALLAVGIVGVTVSLSVSGMAQGGRRPPGPMPKPKNLKVLKKLPPDQLIPVMQKINASLGVRCDFCHVIKPDRTGFERDDKPTKKTARQMILMVQDMNTRYKVLEGKATCFMCHHGHDEPETQAPMRMMPGGGPGRRR